MSKLDRKEEKTIFNMKLHETLAVEGMYVLRVPSGWIYYGWDSERDEYINGVFVPTPKE
mgnify:CR=1 FL=1